MSKHTPGPWILDKERVAHFYRVYDSELRLVATVPAGSRTKPSWLAIPNLQLIAAAPDLYEALKDALSLIETLSPMEGDTCRKARAAIAKAEGL